MDRIKCKECIQYALPLCILKKRSRNAGKKRWCFTFFQKVHKPKVKIEARYVPFIPKSDRKKYRELQEQQQQEIKKQELEIQQKKLALMNTMPNSYEKKSVNIKKPNILKKIINKVCSG